MTGDMAARSRRRLYLDTSAYLAILLRESGWERLSAETEGAELATSALLLVEARRTVTRLAREGRLTADQYHACLGRMDEDEDVFVIRDVTPDLCRAAPMPAVVTPRSLDLVHLRSALWFASESGLDQFVTLDATQRLAAIELGLPASGG